jgi:hypothetical protein
MFIYITNQVCLFNILSGGHNIDGKREFKVKSFSYIMCFMGEVGKINIEN